MSKKILTQKIEVVDPQNPLDSKTIVVPVHKHEKILCTEPYVLDVLKYYTNSFDDDTLNIGDMEKRNILLALQRKVIGVIIEDGRAVGVGLQGLLVGLVSLFLVLHLLVPHVAGDGKGLREVVVVPFLPRQGGHHVALVEHGLPVLLDIAQAQLEQLDVVVVRMHLPVQVNQAADRLAPYPVERRVDVVHHHGQVVALDVRTHLSVADEIFQPGEEGRVIAHAAEQLRPPDLRRGVRGIHLQGLVIIGERHGILPGGHLGVRHHRKGLGVVI